ncbi:uncharacterized protein LOC124921541 [Impatiens glandulifera]|uniref:uncharacterized protein LOC124921541 n=1 Tax=Impatiens glandulifera TaxID=253017 RepID=UPI001FB0D196|nr:uncharacterized protein LOC124921541 [Impatiens glandulifera]
MLPPFSIGNCKVLVDAKKYNLLSSKNGLEISLSQAGTVKISEVDGIDKSINDNQNMPAKETGEFYFVLLNPKDLDSQTRSQLLDVFELYTKELPAMKFAANTGKQSMFLERCVMKGKYCTLLLKSRLEKDPRKVIGAITYQIIPVDTQYAEVPLAAVNSFYQQKGLGRLLCGELKNRLHGVGIRNIFCWGDKESEGFWHKQGFVSIGEVNGKGKACRLPIKTSIRKALCFLGGSTLMVSSLNTKNSGSEQGINLSEDVEASNMPQDLRAAEMVADTDLQDSPCSSLNKKKRGWVTCTSLKSKKVKAISSHQTDSHPKDVFLEDLTNNYSFDENPAEISKNMHLIEPNSGYSSKDGSSEKRSHECTPMHVVQKDHCRKELQAGGESCRIMLMNIADDEKKSRLTKIIEDLGGVVTMDGSVSTHVVTGKVRRTLNFCTALCSGSWIVSPSWLKQCCREGKFVDEMPYVLKDDEYELKYKIELRAAILRAKNEHPRALLKGYSICFVAHIQPPLKTLAAIAISAGGNVINGVEEAEDVSKTIMVACEEDSGDAIAAALEGMWTFGSEWFLDCIMKQELDFDALQFVESL